ncbi:DUF342 domain-containing protein [Thermosipho ferrireducens]|uniref:DUF342 domain-containing protein n=1 Tax=Thermosipho ferrireducens TaxID=2571116 RepID=A0ABX7S966_9BACT|nr:FapA family protein [Thermosipho ferrireducens]QTA37725.1 DUF342 domain-containing protein [Thermosipho ferrireducens]
MSEIIANSLEELYSKIEKDYGPNWWLTYHIDINEKPDGKIVAKLTPISELKVSDKTISQIKLPEEIDAKKISQENFEKLLEEHSEPKIDVSISEDKMEAFLTIIPGLVKEVPTYEELIKALKDAGIKAGIDKNAIEKIVKEKITLKPVIVARGVAPTPSKDATLEFLFPKDGISISNDSESFERKFNIFTCKKDDILVKKNPPLYGKPGYNVLGETIPATAPEDINLNLYTGKNTRLSEDGTKILSDVNGQPYISSDGKVNVREILVIEGNLTYETYQTKIIDFPGTIWIKGNVEGDFKLVSKKDIYIDGILSGGFNLQANESVIVKKGIFGRGIGKLEAEKNVIAKFINETIILAGNEVKTGEYIMNSTIVAKNNVIVSGKGLIIGGEISAGYSIITKTLGNFSGIKTSLRVGINFEYQKRYTELNFKLSMNFKKLSELSLAYKRILDLLRSTENKKEKEKLSLTIIKINHAKNKIINDMRKIKTAITALKIERYREKITQNAYVLASEECFPGVVIQIYDETIKIQDKLGPTLFTLSKKSGKIVSRPYKSWKG